ncbi:MAG: hypothetical protein GF346_04360, partial [Candidatus Eisenbacteria bacterium]|nr:hypothetical protein [Candidatus Latescibacterota bacterium]MBD3301660.1 hypothetical protein [Candidatus Eisenbacteria bacterium]
TIIALALPFAAWLPKSPVPLINTANLLTIGSLLSIGLLTLRGKAHPVVPTSLNVPVILLLLVMGLSAIFGPYVYGAGVPSLGHLRTLWGVLSGFLVFFVVTHLVQDRDSLWRLVGWVLAASAVGLLGPLREAFERGFGARTGGGVGDINRMAALLAMAAVFAFVMIPAYRGIRKIGTTVASLLLAVGLVLPNSRGAYVGFLLAALPQALRTSVLGTVMLVAFLGSAIFWAPDFVRDRFLYTVEAATEGEESLDDKTGGRLSVWEAQIQVLTDHPLHLIAGVGYGNLQDAVREHLGRRKAGHNLYLETAVEMGLIGLGFLLWMLWRAWKLGSVLIARGGRSLILGRAYHGMLACLLILNLFGQRFYDFSLAGFFGLLSGCVALEERFTRPAEKEHTS